MMKLSLVSLIFAIIFSACGMNFQTDEKPEDKVVELQTRSDSPKSKIRDYRIGDEVAVIKDDGVLEVVAQIEDTCGKLVFATSYYRGRPGKEIWMPVELATNLNGDEKNVPKGYKVRIGDGRFTEREWFPSSQIFPAPWANNMNLKIGDPVYEKTFGNFEPPKGVIIELPVNENSDFGVRFDSSNRTEFVKRKEIFSSIRPAAAENLSIGDIVYYDKSYWAIVVGKRDDKIIVRETGFPAKDKIVDISKLQTLK